MPPEDRTRTLMDYVWAVTGLDLNLAVMREDLLCLLAASKEAYYILLGAQIGVAGMVDTAHTKRYRLEFHK